jgi:hypothetical protein
MFPCCLVRESVNVNGSFRNARASPTTGAPSDPGGGRLMVSIGIGRGYGSFAVDASLVSVARSLL